MNIKKIRRKQADDYQELVRNGSLGSNFWFDLKWWVCYGSEIFMRVEGQILGVGNYWDHNHSSLTGNLSCRQPVLWTWFITQNTGERGRRLQLLFTVKITECGLGSCLWVPSAVLLHFTRNSSYFGLLYRFFLNIIFQNGKVLQPIQDSRKCGNFA